MKLTETRESETISWDVAVRKLADHLILEDSHLVTLLLTPDLCASLKHLPAGWGFFLVGAQTVPGAERAVFHAPHAGPQLVYYASLEVTKVTIVKAMGVPMSYPIAILAIPDALDTSVWADGIGIGADTLAGTMRIIATATEEAPNASLVPMVLIEALKVAHPDHADEIDGMVVDLDPEDVRGLWGQQS